LGVRRGRRFDVEPDVMTLLVLVHAIGEVASSAALALFHFAGLNGDKLDKGVGKGVDLRAGDVLAGDKDVFVKRHQTGPLWLVVTRSASAFRVEPARVATRAGKGRRTIANSVAGAMFVGRLGALRQQLGDQLNQ